MYATFHVLDLFICFVFFFYVFSVVLVSNPLLHFFAATFRGLEQCFRFNKPMFALSFRDCFRENARREF